jgi:hypothetical protein
MVVLVVLLHKDKALVLEQVDKVTTVVARPTPHQTTQVVAVEVEALLVEHLVATHLAMVEQALMLIHLGLQQQQLVTADTLVVVAVVDEAVHIQTHQVVSVAVAQATHQARQVVLDLPTLVVVVVQVEEYMTQVVLVVQELLL